MGDLRKFLLVIGGVVLGLVVLVKLGLNLFIKGVSLRTHHFAQHHNRFLLLISQAFSKL